MGTHFITPHLFKLAVALVIIGCATWILWFPIPLWINKIAGRLKYQSASCRIPFVRIAIILFALHQLGQVLIQAILCFRVAKHYHSFDWPGYLILVGDVFTIVFIWIWLTMFRGPTVQNSRCTTMEILAALAVIIPVDLALSFQFQGRMLFPSAVLNASVLGFAIFACIIRYPRGSAPLKLAVTAYSLTKAAAYGSVQISPEGLWKFEPRGPEGWMYYALGFLELIIFILFCDLLLGEQESHQPELLRPFLTNDRLVAITALLVAAIDEWELISSLPVYRLLLVAVPALAVVITFRGASGEKPRVEKADSVTVGRIG